MDTDSRIIRQLLSRSNKGDFAASSQLAQIYANGLGVDEDLDKAEDYKIKCADQLNNSTFGIHSIKLINYRGFENLDISFSSQRIKKSKERSIGNTTVLVGNNGSGKSTILEAIQKSLTHISSRLTTRSHNGDQIDELEISNGAEFSTIIPCFYFNNTKFSFEISQSRPLIELKKKSKYTELNEIGKILRMANSAIPDFSFPLLASYTVERANDVTTKDIEESEELLNSQIWNKSTAYSKSLSGKADFKLFFRWFKELVEDENASFSDIETIRTQIKAKKNELNSPLLKALIAETKNSPSTKALIDGYKMEISRLESQLNEQSTTDNKVLEFVKEAIYSFLPGFSELRLQRSPLDLTLTKDGETLSVLQLSQGEKSLLALVADIARRLTLLNPDHTNPLNGCGLVLIDEIDLHLHPSWQQKIIKRLESTFKNIQFIVTTHSPQVCHTVDSDNIWLLKDKAKYKAPRGVRGAVSSWVLKNLFEVQERPPEDKYTILLEKYKKMVYEDNYSSPEAMNDRKTLANHFGSDYDVLVELDLYIENREWENDFEED